MSHLDLELQQLKKEVLEMWDLSISQLEKSKKALNTLDKDLAREVIMHEKRLNSYELKIDRDAENILALFTPVAVDLRNVLAALKIINNLERIGDIADGVAKFVLEQDSSFDPSILEKTETNIMFDECIKMVQSLYQAYEDEDTALARSIIKQDEILDQINKAGPKRVAQYIAQEPGKVLPALYVLSTVRKLERIGDQAKNIAEEIIFYVEAKVLKHRNKIERGD